MKILKFIAREDKFNEKVNLNSSLELQKVYNYFFEFKTDDELIINNLEQIEKILGRHVDALKNIKIIQNININVKKYKFNL